MVQFNPITASQYETTERYYQLPKVLFENPRYEAMTLEVKVTYSILKDRLKLSMKNGWIDEEGLYYLVYSNAKLMKILSCSKSKLLKIKKELTKYGLIKEVQQSNSKSGTLANRIYLGNLEFETTSPTPQKEKNSDGKSEKEGGVKKTPPRSQKNTPPVLKTHPSETELNKTNNSEDIISSRKAEKISEEISQPAKTDNQSSLEKSEKYIEPQYYSLLQVIADAYHGRFCQQDLFTGEFQNYTLTHRQKMMIGQYLSEGYVTSQEVISLIDRVPLDCESPLAYLLKSLDNLKEERRLEAKILAHRNAEMAYGA
ncbi:replication initiator protein A [Streptococcus iniae]|uniref:replication initiator protein A n=1 Tax=Streptococcus agalactiae TaxID=1311 RepID=UPI0008D9AC95|nr:replication initiator protein A [Streptococcus agalactiae]ELY5747360.1 replication initiator protein A [Streptococcus iniae]KAF0052046.1 replication initiation protein [Streptococcus agalactiae]OHX26610.1 replication initiation protein [Streptococcus iniae]